MFSAESALICDISEVVVYMRVLFYFDNGLTHLR